MRVVLELRNLALEQIIQYLILGGGIRCNERVVASEGWSASLQEGEPAQVGSITVPRNMLVIEGEPAAVEQIYAFVRRHTLRGGG